MVNRTKRNLIFFLTGLGVILVWRGLWGFMDLYLFPGNKDMSYAASILIGIVILIVDDFELKELSGRLRKKRKSN